MTSPEFRGYRLRFYLYLKCYHFYHYQLVFRINFAVLVLFQLITIKIMICQAYRFNVLEQILLYIEPVHTRYYFKVRLLRSTFFLFFDLQGCSFLIACYILYSGQPLSITKKSLWDKKGSFFLLHFNKKTAFSLHFKKSSSKNVHTFCLDKRLSCYIVVKILVTPDVFFHNFNLKIGR